MVEKMVRHSRHLMVMMMVLLMDYTMDHSWDYSMEQHWAVEFESELDDHSEQMMELMLGMMLDGMLVPSLEQCWAHWKVDEMVKTTVNLMVMYLDVVKVQTMVKSLVE